MSEKRRGLGRGLGALIPTASDAQRPVDVFFPDVTGAAAAAAAAKAAAAGAVDTAASDNPAVRADEGGVRGANTATILVQEAGDEVPDDEPISSPQGDDVPRGTGDLVPVPGARFAELPVDSIRPNSRQPRTVFDEDALEELTVSIREIGVLQPIVVRPARDDESGYELIMGERRWRATQRAGLPTVPAIVRDTDDADLLRDALLENLHRSELNPLEEAAAYQQLLDDFGCTHDELATRISRSRPQISNTLRLLRLPPLVQRRVAAGVLSAGHARALLGLTDGAAIERLAQRIVAEGLSVRATEEIVSLGGDPERPVSASRRSRGGHRADAVDELAARLSDRFETRVKIALGKSKGRITVEFASVQDLNRILSTLSPADAGVLAAPED
ncbi:ParB/RepB/Spo0J family partition protein [Cellulomonas sp. ATA003]|uniref:ParB/RepB/Spo0J family partition protein n=1 Tax=Cellulomonas sp. ATA003 TaxID=3073064 RepID=UPI0028733B15|nr:ParB/RepB/Spo0J family partition protein [Cellulomonas sp. ATA003]WNB85593.1 ParB/RepB/Spo0J family partition protein [Cellulomonas sp. ATA003]